MPLETATHIKDLVISNPANSDGLAQADDHMRLIKAVLTTDIGDAMTSKKLTTVDGSSSAPAVGFAADATTGLYRKAIGVTGVAGRLHVPDAVGALHMYLVEPTGLGKGGVGTGHHFLELDGSTWNNSDFPELATHLGQGGTTFTLPNAYTNGRFPRSRTATVAAGTTQANTVGPHTHPDQAITTGSESVGHTHSFSGTSGSNNTTLNHRHNYGRLAGSGAGGVGGGGSFGIETTATTGYNIEVLDHTHNFSGSTGDRSAAHTHNATVPTPANTGTTETRPEALAVVLCIKT